MNGGIKNNFQIKKYFLCANLVIKMYILSIDILDNIFALQYNNFVKDMIYNLQCRKKKYQTLCRINDQNHGYNNNNSWVIMLLL